MKIFKILTVIIVLGQYSSIFSSEIVERPTKKQRIENEKKPSEEFRELHIKSRNKQITKELLIAELCRIAPLLLREEGSGLVEEKKLMLSLLTQEHADLWHVFESIQEEHSAEPEFLSLCASPRTVWHIVYKNKWDLFNLLLEKKLINSELLAYSPKPQELGNVFWILANRKCWAIIESLLDHNLINTDMLNNLPRIRRTPLSYIWANSPISTIDKIMEKNLITYENIHLGGLHTSINSQNTKIFIKLLLSASKNRIGKLRLPAINNSLLEMITPEQRRFLANILVSDTSYPSYLEDDDSTEYKTLFPLLLLVQIQEKICQKEGLQVRTLLNWDPQVSASIDNFRVRMQLYNSIFPMFESVILAKIFDIENSTEIPYQLFDLLREYDF